MPAPPLRLDRAFIRVAGAGARGFLQGLLTQDAERLAEARVLYAGLLTPQGKLIADMLLWRDGAEDVLIEADGARGADLLRRLTMYKLRAPVRIEEADMAALIHFDGAPQDAAPDPRMPDGALGWRQVVPRSEAVNLENGGDAYWARRIAAGVPDLARDAEPEEVFALEALFEELHGVDFKKGCFVGQENVSRMKRRATTRRKFCPVAFEGEAPAFGAAIRVGDFEIGSVRSGADGRALAFLRLDRAREAIDKGGVLTADGKALRLDPPVWLILPSAREGEA
jgi:tRNA-modifying protein YgfZ